MTPKEKVAKRRPRVVKEVGRPATPSQRLVPKQRGSKKSVRQKSERRESHNAKQIYPLNYNCPSRMLAQHGRGSLNVE
jgi:hypothetical protein